MNILHINTENSFGGASLCAKRICCAQRKHGIDAKMLVAHGKEETFIFKAIPDKNKKDIWYSNPLLGHIKHILMRMPWFWDEEKVRTELKKAQENTIERPYIHLPYSDYKDITKHPLFDWADIIHLHWVAGMLDYPSFFKNVQKPIVWTLHDEHPAIGLMHYQSGFSPLPEEYKKVNNTVIKIKKNAIKYAESAISIVAISKKMQDVCAQSPIIKKTPTTLIHNGVDATVFYPHDKQSVRKFYNIPKDAIVFLFSAYNIWDKRKGLDRVIAALESLALNNIYLICIGEDEGKSAPKTSFRIIQTGKIDNQNYIAELYSASDFFMLSSYEEAFAQTPLEAMACGTPVISTPCGGAPDLIRQFNGVLCSGFNDEDIAKGIKEALTYQNTQGYSISKIRNYIVTNYSYDIIAKQYIDLYNNILNN